MFQQLFSSVFAEIPASPHSFSHLISFGVWLVGITIVLNCYSALIRQEMQVLQPNFWTNIEGIVQMIASKERSIVALDLDETLLAAAKTASHGIFRDLQEALKNNPTTFVPLTPTGEFVKTFRQNPRLFYWTNAATAAYFLGLPEANCDLRAIGVETVDAGWYGHAFPKRKKLNWKMVQGLMMVRNSLGDAWFKETKRHSIPCGFDSQIRGVGFNYYRNIIILCGAMLFFSFAICLTEVWIGRPFEIYYLS